MKINEKKYFKKEQNLVFHIKLVYYQQVIERIYIIYGKMDSGTICS